MTTPDPKLSALAVHLHGQRIGVLNRLNGERHLFSFDEEYLDDPNRHILSLSFKGGAGGIVTATRPTARKIPPFFSNLLPEGNLRTYLADRAGVKTDREFFLLALLGDDLPGGVTVSPLGMDGLPVEEPRPVAEPPRTDGILRFSLAGVQLKFSAVIEAHGGLTIPVHGMGGSWIVKLPSTQFAHVPENEFVMLELARAIGIDVPETRLVPVAEISGLPEAAARLPGNAFVVRRFDRHESGTRIHMEDFAQIFGLFPDDKYGARSYANIAFVLAAEAGEAGVEEFVRRLAFSILIGNGDMHLKNWSLLYQDGRTPTLSPAYDFLATFPYIPGDKLALDFGGSRSLAEISPEQLRRFADKARIPARPAQRLFEEVRERTIEAWRTLDHKDILPADLRSAIDARIQMTAMLRSRHA